MWQIIFFSHFSSKESFVFLLNFGTLASFLPFPFLKKVIFFLLNFDTLASFLSPKILKACFNISNFQSAGCKSDSILNVQGGASQTFMFKLHTPLGDAIKSAGFDSVSWGRGES